MTQIGREILDNTDLGTVGGVALTVPPGTKLARLEAVGGNMNYELDGVTNVPTDTTTGNGERLLSGARLDITGNFTTFRIIRQTSVAAQVVNVGYYSGLV